MKSGKDSERFPQGGTVSKPAGIRIFSHTAESIVTLLVLKIREAIMKIMKLLSRSVSAATKLAIALTCLACLGQSAQAGFFIGSISARFENPTLSGSIRNPATFYNNTGSASYSASGGGATSTFRWGSSGYSSLNFFANQDVQVNSDEPFSFGTVTYYNGTSELSSLVFGVNLVLEFIGSPTVSKLTIPISIVTTNNIGDANANADYISFGTQVPVSFFTYEGIGATAILKGSIVGNPHMIPSDITVLESFTLYTGTDPQGSEPYDPSQYTTYDSPGFSGGFAAPTPVIPEPSSLVLFGIGTLGLIRQVRRRRQTGICGTTHD